MAETFLYGSSLLLYCVQVLQPKDQTQGIFDGDQSKITENTSRPWDVFSNYQPEFKKISRVRHLEDTIIFITHYLK